MSKLFIGQTETWNNNMIKMMMGVLREYSDTANVKEKYLFISNKYKEWYHIKHMRKGMYYSIKPSDYIFC